jgi:general secretion pathway protein K
MSKDRRQRTDNRGQTKTYAAPISSVTDQKGSALIITLLLISIMVGLVVDFVYNVYIDTSSLSNWGNAQKASLIAKSGQTISTLYLKEAQLIKYTDQRELMIPVDYDFGPGISLLIEMEDENAKFNINSIIRDNGKTNEEKLSSLKKMLEFLNINQDIALMIADWIDPDSEPRLSDSEDSAKNDFFWSIDELKLVEGLDEHFDILEPYVTIYKNIGTLVYQVNINTAELPVLLSLHDEMTESLAQNIIDARESYPFEDPSDVVNVAGLETLGTKLGGRTTVKSTIFRITARATANEITRIIESVMDTSSNVLFWREI